MITDVVVAIFDQETLADVLPVVHTNGLGHVARVLTVQRGDLRSQLQRMGVPAEQAPGPVLDASTLLVLSAAARSPMAAGLLLRAGTSAVWIVTRNGEWNAFDDSVTILSPTPATHPPSTRGVPGLHDAPAGPFTSEPATR